MSHLAKKKPKPEEWESSEGNISLKSFKMNLDYSEQAQAYSWAISCFALQEDDFRLLQINILLLQLKVT